MDEYAVRIVRAGHYVLMRLLPNGMWCDEATFDDHLRAIHVCRVMNGGA